MCSDGLFIMAVSGIYGYHATKTGPKCSLVWMASCFIIPPSLKCRYLGTWDEIQDELHILDNDIESENIMPRMLTHADLHDGPSDSANYRLSPEPTDNQRYENLNYEHERNDVKYENTINDYLIEYAEMITSKENEEHLLSQETQVRPPERGQTHEERRRTFVRRKSCSDVSKKGLSLSLSVPQEQTVDDMNVGASPPKPDNFNLKNITALARRMSIPILDKSEDVDHGTKIYAETLIKKSRTTKQFREAFSGEQDDYIPHRAPKTLSKSLTTHEIESACDDLKTESPGSYTNVVAELKLRTNGYNDSRHDGDTEVSGPKLSKSLTTSEIEMASDDYKVESPVHYRNVVKELQQRSYPDDHYNNDGSYGGNSLDQSFTDSVSSDTSHISNSLRRNKSNDSHYITTRSSRTNRYSNSPREDRSSKTLPASEFDSYSNVSSNNRNNDRSVRDQSLKQKSEEPVSDLMKKLTNLTAQTRLATRPSLGNGEGYEPSPSVINRSQSVMNVSSPSVLSPKHERNVLSSSFSSSASSSSDIPVLSYHNVVDPCYRCWKTVYTLDKVGPIRKVLYHKQCFRCVSCNTMLTLNTYCQNVNDKSDMQVYCKKHVPSPESPHISLEAKNLDVMMHHPKLDSVNTNIRGTLEDRRKSQNILPLNIGRAISTPRLDLICGPNDNSDSNLVSKVDKNGNVSLRELKMDDTPKSVWSRSSFSAAKLDLTVPASGRKGSSLYRTVDTWNYL